jgi:hypothetical protein
MLMSNVLNALSTTRPLVFDKSSKIIPLQLIILCHEPREHIRIYFCFHLNLCRTILQYSASHIIDSHKHLMMNN